MAEQNKPPRLQFNISPSNMLQRARYFYDRFLDFQAKFQAFDNHFSAAWGAAFLSDIVKCEQGLCPAVLRPRLSSMTEKLKAKLDEAIVVERDLIYFVRKAFPHDEGKLRSFGQKDFAKARRSQTRMLILMETAVAAFPDNAAMLDAAGFDASRRADYEAKRIALRDATVAQIAQKGINQSVTKEYYENLNTVYGRMVSLATASKNIFMDDYANWVKFLIYKGIRRRHRKLQSEDLPLKDAVKGVEEVREEVK